MIELCKHLDDGGESQKSKTPWINRGHVLAKGTPDEPGEYGKCPLGCDLGFC